MLGDYHNAALAANGKLYTWGAFSHGALGLGDPLRLPLNAPGGFKDRDQLLRAQEREWGNPPAVEVPSEVRFDHGRKTRKDRFCFSVAAAGWHTGALVIDLEVCEFLRLDRLNAEFVLSLFSSRTRKTKMTSLHLHSKMNSLPSLLVAHGKGRLFYL